MPANKSLLETIIVGITDRPLRIGSQSSHNYASNDEYAVSK